MCSHRDKSKMNRPTVLAENDSQGWVVAHDLKVSYNVVFTGALKPHENMSILIRDSSVIVQR